MKKAGFACFALAAAVLAWWLISYLQVPAASRSLFMQQSYQVDVEAKDDFGDTVKTRKEVMRFTPGLLDVAGPVAGGFGALGVALLFLDRRRKRA